MALKYIDISTYQRDVDYEAVAREVDGVILRIGCTGYGTHTPFMDNMFLEHYSHFKALGVPVGCYYFTLAYNDEVCDKEINWLKTNLKNFDFDLPVFIDAENQEHSEGWTSCSKAMRTRMMKKLMTAIEDDGYYVGLYANLNWLNNVLDMTQLSEFDVWCAQYNTVCSYKGTYHLWQYTSQEKITGIKGGTDCSLSYIDYASLIKEKGLNGKEAPEPQTQPVDKDTQIRQLSKEITLLYKKLEKIKQVLEEEL